MGAILLAGSALISKVLGVIRDMVIASVFGVGSSEGIYALDSYYAAFRVPDLIYAFLVAGAMSAAFIPLYTQLKKKSQKEASLFGSSVIHALLILLLIGSAGMWLLAPYFVPWITPGFTESLQSQTVVLTRIMLISPLFLGLSAIFQGVENSHKHFLGIALAPLVYNLSLILGAWFFGEAYGVQALAWAVVIGSVFHFIVQWPSVWKTPFKHQWVWQLKSKAMKDLVFLTVPRLFGIGLSQFSVLIDTVLASLLTLGSLSIYNYALNLQSLPHGVVAVSVSVAVFSTLSEHDENPVEFKKTLFKSLHSIMFWVFPAVFGLFLLRAEIVELLLFRGAFDSDALAQTSMMLGIFVWAALGQSLIPLFARAFYALKDTKTPVLIAFFSVGIQIALSLILILVLDLPVWALAISAIVASVINALLLLVFMNAKIKASFSDYLGRKQILIFLNTSLMSGLILILQTFSYPSLIVELSLMIALGGGVYLGLSKLSRTTPGSL